MIPMESETSLARLGCAESAEVANHGIKAEISC